MFVRYNKCFDIFGFLFSLSFLFRISLFFSLSLLWPFYYFICLMRLFVVDHYMNNSLVRIEFIDDCLFTKVKSSSSSAATDEKWWSIAPDRPEYKSNAPFLSNCHQFEFMCAQRIRDFNHFTTWTLKIQKKKNEAQRKNKRRLRKLQSNEQLEKRRDSFIQFNCLLIYFYSKKSTSNFCTYYVNRAAECGSQQNNSVSPFTVAYLSLPISSSSTTRKVSNWFPIALEYILI